MLATYALLLALSHESVLRSLTPNALRTPAVGKGPITIGAQLEAIRAKQDAIADRSRVIDQKTEYFLGTSPGRERDLFAKPLLKEIEEARADNAKITPAIELLMQALQPKPARDR